MENDSKKMQSGGEENEFIFSWVNLRCSYEIQVATSGRQLRYEDIILDFNVFNMKMIFNNTTGEVKHGSRIFQRGNWRKLSSIRRRSEINVLFLYVYLFYYF